MAQQFCCGVQDEQEAVFLAFKAFFEDEGIQKVWHNYSFDRHVLANHVGRLPLRPVLRNATF